MKNPWKTLSQKVIYENKLGYRFRVDQVITPAGTPSDYSVYENDGYVAIVALTPDNQLILVRQWRYPIEEESLEIPAGLIEKGLSPLEVAKKELSEEVGGESSDWSELGSHWLGNGALKMKGYLFLAKNVQLGTSHQNLEEEFMTTELMPLKEALNKNLNGEFLDIRTQLGLLFAEKHLL